MFLSYFGVSFNVLVSAAAGNKDKSLREFRSKFLICTCGQTTSTWRTLKDVTWFIFLQEFLGALSETQLPMFGS